LGPRAENRIVQQAPWAASLDSRLRGNDRRGRVFFPPSV
jgi:hypothetical protein